MSIAAPSSGFTTRWPTPTAISRPGRVEYVLYDKLAIYDWLKTPEGACCEIAPTELNDPAYFGSGVAIALRKGDDALVQKFNAAIDGIVADGTYAKINAKYFPFPILAACARVPEK